MRELTKKQRQFVAEFMKDHNASKASIRAGYTDRTEGNRLMKNPVIKAEIDKVRGGIAREAEYNLEKALKETDEAKMFAIETKNANAVVRAVEHKAKLSGLHVEKIDLNVTKVDITAALSEARARVDFSPQVCSHCGHRDDKSQIIDVPSLPVDNSREAKAGMCANHKPELNTSKSDVSTAKGKMFKTSIFNE